MQIAGDNYNWLEDNRNSKLLVDVTGDLPGMETQIGTDVLECFQTIWTKLERLKKISLFLYTRGGDTMTAYSLVFWASKN